MKTILYNILFVSLLSLLFTGCDDSNPVSTDVSEVESLYSPENQYSVTLQPNGTETFEWAPAKAVDGGMVMYEVAFDSVGGDFSEPAYRIPSDNNGVATTATVSHKTLNKAAAQIGLESEETGKMDWTVISSRGVNETVSPGVNTIQVTRLPGFANPPTNVFVTGAGTEAGENLSDAIQMKSTGEGQFEIYTKLTTDGSYKFVSNTSGDPREFIIEGASLKEGGSAPTIDQDGVYRISLDFTAGSASLVQITNVEFYSSPHDEFLYNLEYQGEGVFLAEGVAYSFYEWGWGLDSRYKFRLTVNEDGQESYEWWGNDEADVSRPNDSSPASYWFTYPVPESSDQWQYTFKFNEDKHQSLLDIYLRFEPDIEHYTHEVVKVGDQ